MKPDKIKMVCFATGFFVPISVLADLIRPFFEWPLLILMLNLMIGITVTHLFKGGVERMKKVSGLDESESSLRFSIKGFFLFNTLFFWFIPKLNS